MTFQLAQVNKIWACVGMLCDAGNVAIFMKHGGMIVPEKDVEVRMRPDSQTTGIRRCGKTFTMDAWVRRSAVLPLTKASRVSAGRV